MRIQAVIFDFGNVVGLFDRRCAATQLAALSDLGAEPILQFLLEREHEDDYESGRMSTAQMVDFLRQRCRVRGSDKQIHSAYANMFALNPEVCQLIPRLKPPYRLVLLSNTNEMHHRQFREQFAEVLSWFDGIVLSHEVGVRKPHPQIYQHAVELAGCPARECLFIDDLPANVQGAREAGLQGVVYYAGQDLAAELVRLGLTLQPLAERTGA
jgi:glucose-1-phosphatase